MTISTVTFGVDSNFQDQTLVRVENLRLDFRQGNFKQVITEATDILNDIDESQTLIRRELHLLLGESYFAVNQPINAINEYLHLVYNFDQDFGRITDQAEAYYLVGKVYVEIDAHDEAERCFTRSYDYFLDADDALGQAKCLQAMAVNAFEARDYTKASGLYSSLLEDIDSYTNDGVIIGIIYQGLMESLLEVGKYDKVISYGRQYQGQGIPEHLETGKIDHLMGQAYLQQNEFAKARDKFLKARLFQPDNLDYSISLASSQIHLMDWDAAKDILNQTVISARGQKDNLQLARALVLQARLARHQDDPEATQFFLEGAEKLSKNFDDFVLKKETIQEFITLHQITGNYQKELDYLDQLRQLNFNQNKEVRDFQQHIQNANVLASTLEERFQSKLSSDYRSPNITDNNAPQVLASTELETDQAGNSDLNTLNQIEEQQALELSKKERMIMQQQWELQKAQIEAANQQQRLFVTTLVFSIVTILVLAVFVWRGYRSKRIISLKNKNLASQQEELEKAKEELQKALNKAQQNSERLARSNVDLKAAQSHLIQAEKMSSLGQLTAGIVHEIKNPVNFVRAGIETLDSTLGNTRKILAAIQNLKEDKSADSKVLEKLQEKLNDELSLAYEIVPNILKDVLFGTNRINEITNSLRIFSRQDGEQLQSVGLHDILDSALLILKTKYMSVAKIKLNYDSEIGEIECFPGQLNQVFVNLINNAVDAIPKKGVITVTTVDMKDKVSIEISDTGSGIPEEVLEHIFEPFYTTKEAGRGTGLGLSISYSIIEKHGGDISVKSELGRGTQFKIILDKKIKDVKIKESEKNRIQEDILN